MAENAYQEVDDLDGLFGDGEGEGEDFDNEFSQVADEDTPIDPSFAQGNDGDELNALLAEGGPGEGLDLNELNDRELDRGEKADDAQDYEDISDDDLPDEEIATGGEVQGSTIMLPGIAEHAVGDVDFDNADGYDDLFGGPSSPPAADDSFALPTKPAPVEASGDGDADSIASDLSDTSRQDLFNQLNKEPVMNAEEARLYNLQRLLLQGDAPETEEANLAEWAKLEFPDYKPGETPYFNKLFPPKPGVFKDNDAKYPTKPPKLIRPTKVTLDIEKDQRALFNSAATGTIPELRHNLIRCEPAQSQEEADSSDESDFDEPLPGGITMQDLEFLCTDFDTLSALGIPDADLDDFHARAAASDAEMFAFNDFSDFEQPRKKRKTGRSAHDIVSVHQLDLPSFHDPELATAKLSAKVIIDLNDSDLLVEEVDPETLRAKAHPSERTRGATTMKSRLSSRFKLSNDAEYDLLKQNHQHKVRGQLGQLNVEHSVPAIRLQYPYFKVSSDVHELRNFHRKRMLFKHPFTFNKPNRHKRKLFKGKTTKEIYGSTKELSVGDNSTAVLLEYSEEHPIMLAHAGMGSKIVNYYRRKTKDDATRPKHELGETQVLLPEDKSPFYNIGHVDPGGKATALYNSMYRAPLFEQDMKPQDFLVVRETTGMTGHQYYIRKVDNVFVVGQELPSLQVPGTSSRMVTTAAKNRLKAISYRLARKKKSHRIKVEEVTRHFPGTTDMQNRQKMKEFMIFNKEAKEWEMKPGEAIPDEEAIQELISPEDLCLLESMYVGAQYLQDAGFADDDDEDKDNEDGALEQQLAPWRLTKNFQQAIQEKAHLIVYGEGDPSGRGEAMSFLKTSMKGGFKAQGGPVPDASKLKKELGGHSYNVAMQQKLYEESKRRVWEKQAEALGSKHEPTDLDAEGDVDSREDARMRGSIRATPVGTPAGGRHRDDETGTSFSRRSGASQTQKYLRIKRVFVKNGEKRVETYVENDPAVIKAYTRRRQQSDKLQELRKIEKTGNAEVDAANQKRIEDMIVELQAKASRPTKRRKKTKNDAGNAGSADGDAGSPNGEPGTPAPSGREPKATQRKCANCGQVGHIKTNKKSVERKCNNCDLPFDRKVGSALSSAPVLASGWRD